MRFPLLARVIIAIILGIVIGQFLPLDGVRLFATFNGIFGQFLSFIVPLIIVGLVTPAIADIGKGAGKVLIIAVLIAYIDTIIAGLLAYGVGAVTFPSIIASVTGTHIDKYEAIDPFFSISIPAMIDVMSALVFSFMMGVCTAYGGHRTMKALFDEFRQIIVKTIEKAIVPLLPLYIFGIFLMMTSSGQVYHILKVFALIILVIFVLHLFILLYEFIIAGIVVKKNPFRMLYNMLPAYFTALGTSSSAATIPVTLRQTKKNGVPESIADFTIPLCATIHMSGSAMKITACALTICLLNGIPYDFGSFIHFVMMLGIIMVAAPGVPGGAIMAALAPLASILGFDGESQALMIALYIAMDSFGTACNVTGDGAIAAVVGKFFGKQTVNQQLSKTE